ncbi:MAG: exodeoxyribonuclease V subunit alpha [Methylococcales bacterium]|nr:exodeoxyribonuclease V subunit alpha [Methylococcales bacterium]
MKVLSELDNWVACGWLNRLNRAFAAFLHEQDPNAPEALLWAGALLSHQLDRGEIVLDLLALLSHPAHTLAIPDTEAPSWEQQSAHQAWARIRPLFTHWRHLFPKSPLVSDGPGNTPLVLVDHKLYLRRYWQYRETVHNHLNQRLKPFSKPSTATLKQQLASLFSEPALESPDWQKIACALALRAPLTLLTGGPGTGKTTTLTKLLAVMLQNWQHNRPPVILLAAPTGKAAARVSASIASAIDRLPIADSIKQSIPKQAVTLHRLLGRFHNSRRFLHHRDHPLLADLVVVDEASMIDLEMMAALLDALPLTSPLILLGDKDQLASVEAGAVLGELCQGAEHAAYWPDTRRWIADFSEETLPECNPSGSALNQQTVMLRYSHRFTAHSGIGQLAKAVNQGDRTAALAILQHTDRYPDLLHNLAQPTPMRVNRMLKTQLNQQLAHYLSVLNDCPESPQARDAWASEVLTAFDHIQVLCPQRQGLFGVNALNERIAQWLFPDAGLWYVGRPVMVTRNDYALGLMNGDIGVTLRTDEGRLRVAFFDSNNSDRQRAIHWLSPMRLTDVETAFAITVHKSQGSEFNHVLLVLPERSSPVINRALLYTAITRAKQHFTLLESGAEHIFANAIQLR